MLYDLGFEPEHPEDNIAEAGETCVFDPPAPDLTLRQLRSTLDALMACLPLRMGQARILAGRRVGKLRKKERWAKVRDPFKGTAVDGSKERAAMEKAGVTIRDMAPVYFSTDPYHEALQERLDIRQYNAYKKRGV